MPSLGFLQELIVGLGRSADEYARMRDAARDLEGSLSSEARKRLNKLDRDYTAWTKRAQRSQKELEKLRFKEPILFIERMAALIERDTEQIRNTTRAVIEIVRKWPVRTKSLKAWI